MIAATPAWAEDATADARFDQATALMASGDNAGAVERFISIADDFPDAGLADDALFSAAQLLEEKLSKPARAAALYERLVRDHPDSRNALAAERRLELLRASLGPDNAGAAALGRYTDILQRYGERGHDESVRLMEALVADEPDWSGLASAMLWLGRAHLRRQQFGSARTWFLRVAERWPDGETGYDAHYGAGEAAIHLGQFDAAEAHFRAMPVEGDAGRRRSRDDALAWVERERTRAALYTASFAVLVLVLIALLASLWRAAGTLRAAARALARPPTEALYMLPVSALMIAAALTGHREIAPAVGIIVAGGVALTWVSGAALRAAETRSRVLAAAHAGAVAVAILALCYVAVHRTRLLDLIISTVRFGPDV